MHARNNMHALLYARWTCCVHETTAYFILYPNTCLPCAQCVHVCMCACKSLQVCVHKYWNKNTHTRAPAHSNWPEFFIAPQRNAHTYAHLAVWSAADKCICTYHNSSAGLDWSPRAGWQWCSFCYCYITHRWVYTAEQNHLFLQNESLANP